MTRETKYGIVALVGLAIIVPTVFLIINVSVSLFGLMLNHPGYVLTSIVSAFIGSGLTKLTK